MTGFARVVTLGCRLNIADSALLYTSLAECGYTPSETEPPDVLIVNTCAVTAEAERKTRQTLRNLDPLITELELGMPYSLTARCAAPVTIAHPDGTEIVMKFRPNRWVPKGVTVTWRDGLDAFPAKVEGSHPKLQYAVNGLLVHGSRYSTLGDSHAAPPIIIAETGKGWGPAVKAEQSKWMKKVGAIKFNAQMHYAEFITAVRKGDPRLCGSRPAVAVPFTETLLLGLIATRFQGRELLFDETAKRITNVPEANDLFKAPSRGVWDVRKLAGV